MRSSLPSGQRAARLARPLLVAALAFSGLACPGGDGGGEPSGPVTLPIRLVDATAAPLGVVVGIVRDVRVPAGGLAGTLDAAAVVARRVDDSTLALVVPAGTVAGPRPLRLATGDGRVLEATLTVTAPIGVGDPVASVDSIFDAVDAMLAAADSALADTASIPIGADTAGMRRMGAAVRDTIAALRTAFAQASPADQRLVAQALAANMDVFAWRAGGSPVRAARDLVVARGPAGPMSTHGPALCVRGAECAAALGEWLDSFASAAWIIAGTAVGVELVGTAGGLPGRIAAGLAGATAVTTFLWTKHNELVDQLLTPMIATLDPDYVEPELRQGAMLRVGPATTADAQSPVTAGRPAAITVGAEYRSLTTADLPAIPASTGFAGAYLRYQAAWRELAGKVRFFSLGMPQVGATPARTDRGPVPATQLAIGSVGPTPWTATSSITGDLWLVTFENTRAGQAHDVTLTVRFAPPGFAEQSLTRTVRVQPATVAVATVTVAPADVELAPGGTRRQLLATLRDSAGATIAGRTPTWTSSRSVVASVDAAGMVTTGADTGSATIAATADGKQGSALVRVVGPIWRYADQGSTGVPKTGARTQVVAVNDSGWIAGWGSIDGSATAHAFTARDGALRYLATNLILYTQSMNGRGDVVTNNAGASVWRNGVRTLLPPLSGGTPETGGPVLTATGINDEGDIVGWQGSYGDGTTGYPPRSIRWTAGGSATALLAGDTLLRPYLITAAGIVAGRTGDDPATMRAFVLENGQLRTLPGITNVQPLFLGPQGDLVLQGTGAQGERIYHWTGGTTATVLPLQVNGMRPCILADGRVLGASAADPAQLVTWNGTAATPLVRLTNEWGTVEAQACNARGQVGGVRRGQAGDTRVFLLEYR